MNSLNGTCQAGYLCQYFAKADLENIELLLHLHFFLEVKSRINSRNFLTPFCIVFRPNLYFSDTFMKAQHEKCYKNFDVMNAKWPHEPVDDLQTVFYFH